MTKSLRISSGIDGIPTNTIPDDPTQFVSWFKSVGLKRWFANGDTRNAVAGPGVSIGGQISTPATVSASGLVTGVNLTDASAIPIFATAGGGVGAVGLTETLKIQGANTILAGPTSGASGQPNFRALVAADLPSVGFNNITPDSHPSVPVGVGLGPNDEFESGTSIDLTGTRYSGATAWSNFNISTSTNTVTQGGLVLNPVNTVANTVNGFSQPIVGTTWQYDCKASAITFNPSAMGMFIATSGLKMLYLNAFINGASSLVEVQAYTNPTTFSSTLANFSFGSPGLQTWVYMRISFNGTNIFLQFSTTGHNGSYKTLLTTTAAAFLGGSPTLVGLASNLQNSTQYQAVWDWFRQTA